MLPTLTTEMGAETEPAIATRRYEISREGLFSRRERMVEDHICPWTLLLRKDAAVHARGSLFMHHMRPNLAVPNRRHRRAPRDR